jgi:transcription antitermination factor NusA-like protein
MEVEAQLVEDKQLSLAIGKKGQNVRPGGQADGWRSTSRARKRSAARSRRSRDVAHQDGQAPDPVQPEHEAELE